MTPHERLCEIVKGEVGVKESRGDNHGPRVEEYQRAVDNHAQGESWCMAFVQWAIKKVEAEFGIKSPIWRAEHCLTVWKKTDKKNRVLPSKVTPGCIIIWQHGDTTNGHTGIVTANKGAVVETVEGNTSSGVTVERNGDGVYARTRSVTPTGSMKVLGFIDPFPGI